MIQLNLLPDVKLEFIKAKRLKRTVTLLSILASAVSLTLLIFMFVIVSVIQKRHLTNLDNDIRAKTSELSGTKDLDKILTVQNQLNSLTGLHDKKQVVTRVLGFAEQFTPANVSVSTLALNITESSMVLSGKADSFSTINKFVDTLKFTNYQNGSDTTTAVPAFTNVVLTNFTLGKDAAYSISLKFDPKLFDTNTDATLVIPKNKITTRSEVEKPSALFQTNTTTGQ